MASQDNLNRTLQPCPPFSPEVEALTNSYLSPIYSILPIFAPASSNAPFLNTQRQVTYQSPVPANRNSKAYNYVVIQREMVPSHSEFKASLNSASNLGHLASVNSLGITRASQTSAPSTPPQSNHRRASGRTDHYHPKNECKGEFSNINGNDNSHIRSPSTTSTFTSCSKLESTPQDQEKGELNLDPSKLKTGFTPLIKQGEAAQANNIHSRKKIHFSVKGNTQITSPVSPRTDDFGPPLQPAKDSKQSTFVQSSSNVQANSSDFGHQELASNSGQKFTFLALDIQHAEYLRIQMEKKLAPEMLEMLEIKTFSSQIQASSAAEHTPNAQPAHTKSQKQRLIAFDKQHAETMRKMMAPQLLETVEIILISQLQREVRPRMTVKLTTSRNRPAAAITPLKPLKEFHLFPSLPAELQHRIWSLTIPGPRTIHLRSSSYPGLDIFLPKCRPPTPLQVCAQSRSIALRTLEPAFQTTSLHGAYTYFDFSRDVLRLGDGSNVAAAKKMALSTDPFIVLDRKRVRHLEIPMRIQHTRHMYNCLAALICLAPARGWPGIRTLTFTGEAGNEGVPERMPVVEVVRADEGTIEKMIKGLVVAIKEEFRMVWEELWFMPDCGLKVVYLEKGEP